MTGYFAPMPRRSVPEFGRIAADLPWWRARREGGKPGWRLSDLRAEDVFGRDNLVAVYQHHLRYGGQAPGRDGITCGDLGPQAVGQLAGELSEYVLSGRYRPSPMRLVNIPKAKGGYRQLQIASIADRWACSAANLAVAPAYEYRFRRWSHGFRARHSCLSLVADLMATIAAEQLWVVAACDIRGAFDHADAARISGLLHQHIRDQRIADFIASALGADRQPSVGIPQGCALSPLALNIDLHYGFDVPWRAEPLNPPCWRYADDLTCASQSVPDAESSLARIASLLSITGYSVQLDPPADLRTGQTASLLGLAIRLDGQLRLCPSQDAIAALRDLLYETHEEPNPIQRARMVLQGWIRAYGPTYGDQRDEGVETVLRTLAGMGFAELTTADHIHASIQTASQQWARTLRRARKATTDRLRRQVRADAPRGASRAAR